MFEDKKIISIIPVQNMKVRLSRESIEMNENGEDVTVIIDELKDVVCLALTKDSRYDNRRQIHPMIFEKVIDFAESDLTTIEDLYYVTD